MLPFAIRTHRTKRRNWLLLIALIPLLSLAVTHNPLWMAAQAEQEAMKTLSVIPVFVVTDSEGKLLPYSVKNILVQKAFLQYSDANSDLAILKAQHPELGSKITAIPLHIAIEKISLMNKQLSSGDKKIVLSVIARKIDIEKATELLLTQGFTHEQIKNGLVTPVFFTIPSLEIKTTEGPKNLVFFEYDEAERSIARLGDASQSSTKIHAADLTRFTRLLENEKNNRYIFYPTAEYFRLVKEQNTHVKSN